MAKRVAWKCTKAAAPLCPCCAHQQKRRMAPRHPLSSIPPSPTKKGGWPSRHPPSSILHPPPLHLRKPIILHLSALALQQAPGAWCPGQTDHLYPPLSRQPQCLLRIRKPHSPHRCTSARDRHHTV